MATPKRRKVETSEGSRPTFSQSVFVACASARISTGPGVSGVNPDAHAKWPIFHEDKVIKKARRHG
ncbi:hypothetical protein ColTof4_14092 [Colletotrichum tofieldiae]|nr:hypothetical protein ColTof3_02992 [Colletotrichum tofieldiae]GKT81669.1 hypothetical protein ColTof4_14092 [Colletotrichum tofieldiae]GKT82686.1 hypothetical protein Ct61P_00536 [Colletotrichum tofieldiae]